MRPPIRGRGMRLAASVALAAGLFGFTMSASAAIPGGVWTIQSSRCCDILNSVSFADDLHGWVVGSLGTIRVTADGGAHWSEQNGPEGTELYGVSAPDASHAWAVGANETIIATADGGASLWTLQRLVVGDNPGTLLGVSFPDDLHGWAVGSGGEILATSDGGSTWTSEDSRTSNYLTAVDFVDDLHGWAVGSHGTILVTVNGGATWTWPTEPASYTLNSVSFANDEEGWAVGDQGTILHTDDGGQEWVAQSSGGDAYLDGVSFANADNGIAVGWPPAVVGQGIFAVILHTFDGGATWQQETSKDFDRLSGSQQLDSVSFVDPEHAWTAGGFGLILDYARRAIVPPRPNIGPSVVGTPGSNGWYDSDVLVSWGWMDGDVPIDPSNCTTETPSQGEGILTLTATCADLNGNIATDTYVVKVDKTPPVVAFAGDAGSYTVDQQVTITCAAGDAVSGVATTSCADITAPAYTFALGNHNDTATATDIAGNVGTGSTSFTVNVTYASLRNLVSAFSSSTAVADGLNSKLAAAEAAAARGQTATAQNIRRAFTNQLNAQAGKAISADHATVLANLAAQL
jgi:photosystem II stability/assembly factor-like uncharacterized protein